MKRLPYECGYINRRTEPDYGKIFFLAYITVCILFTAVLVAIHIIYYGGAQ